MSLLWIRLQLPTLRAWSWFMVVLALTWVPASSVAAASSVLVMVRSIDQSDPAPYELRLRSELSTDGVVAIVVNPVSNPADVKVLAARFGTNTTVEVVVSASEVSGVIWSSDPQMGLEVTRSVRVSTRERDAVAVFALRTVDFLQGARLELEQQRQSKLGADAASRSASSHANEPASAAAAPAARVKPKPAEATATAPAQLPAELVGEPERSSPSEVARSDLSPDRLRFGAAFTLLRSTDKLLWSTAPAVSLVWFFHPNWALGAAVAGPYLNHIRSSSGSYTVTVDQETAGFNLRRRFALGSSLDVEPHAGIGGARYSADATVKPPGFGYHATAWSLLGQGGVAWTWRLGPHLRVLLDVEFSGRFQRPSLKANGQDVTGSSPWHLVVALGPGWAI